MYKEKYIKYKTKYLELKNQIGGNLLWEKLKNKVIKIDSSIIDSSIIDSSTKAAQKSI